MLTLGSKIPRASDMVVSAMQDTLYAKSLEARILSATPLELVVILYDEAIQSVRTARGHLRAGEIRPRSRAVSRAVGILMELEGSLNFEAGGELSRRLAGVYGYMRTTLLDANLRQTDEGLGTAEQLLVSLREAWSAVSRQPAASVPAERHAEAAAAVGLAWGIAADAPLAPRSWSA
jgi:flagellar protein FliS